MSALTELYNRMNGKVCSCGKTHRSSLKEYYVEKNAIGRLPSLIEKYGCRKPFLFADENTWKAAGQKVFDTLSAAGIAVKYHILPGDSKPEEHTVGSAAMHYDMDSDLLIAVGSGVINDTCKIVSRMTGTPYFIVATAPSMDGYNSATSSMERDGLKVSLPTRCPDVILGDLDVICEAPTVMLRSGLGDMLAKYVSVCEWKIAALLLDEPYCEEIASLVRRCVASCVEHADDLMRRDPEAMGCVLESLIICGAAMEFAGCSRPASGVEHYMSHIWDMRGICFGTPVSTHGIQCAIGTLQALKVYRKIRSYQPDREKALAAVKAFDLEAWNGTLREFVGAGAESMIALDRKERKYDPAKHALRLERILANWDRICAIMDEELPDADEIARLLNRMGMPKDPEDIGIEHGLLPLTFKASKDMRDKYVLPRLCWDLGILEECAQGLL